MTKEKLIPLMLSADQKREHIRKKVLEGLQESFPVQSRNSNLEIKDVRIDDRDYSPSEQKDAILKGSTLFETVKSTVIMKDKDGNEVDKIQNFTLAKVPWYTPRGTVIVGGNEYSIANQVRPKPGVYARKRANGVLEANFNTRGGSNFSITMDPEKGEPQLEYGSSNISLYPILRNAGISHEAIAKQWGTALADNNKKNLERKSDKEIDRLYVKTVPEYQRKKDATTKEKIDEIFARYSRSELDPDVTQRTLGHRYATVTPDSLLAASSKVLNVYKNTGDVDDRDNLDFKALYGADDFFKEVIKINARDVARKTAIKMEATKSLRKSLPSGPFTSGILRFINDSQLVAVPTQTNPVELLDASMRVTALGEGGIKSERAIPEEARHIHATQLGALDPFRTPESFRAGVDVRAAMGAHKDTKGNIYVPLYKPKQNKAQYVRAGEITNKIVAFPNQSMSGMVDALVRGKLQRVPASSVDYVMPHPSMSYSPTTNLVPFMESLQGNRVVMGSKMSTQALSLVDREEPYVQVKSPTGHSFEEHVATLVNPTSPVSGTVEKIDGDYVYIRPDNVKTSSDITADGLIRVPYETNFPLAAKTYLSHDLNVKPGVHVNAEQQLADSNFTKNNKLALGRNLSVAYMPYRGANSNDAVVISSSASQKLTSQRMYKISMSVTQDITLSKEKHRTYYGSQYTSEQYAKLDESGVVKSGSIVRMGDPLILALRKTSLTADDMMLGRLHKSLVRPYRECTEVWDHGTDGEVVDIAKTPKRITLTVKTQEPMRVGDKLCYTGDTEVLTALGWINITDVTKDTTLYTLNTAGEIEYHKPIALHHYDNAEQLYILATQQVQLRVTPNHKLYVKRQLKQHFELLEAATVIGKRVKHKKNGAWLGVTPNTYMGINCLDWCRFLGAYVSKGDYNCQTNEDQTITISSRRLVSKHKSDSSLDWLSSILDSGDFGYTKLDNLYTITSSVLLEELTSLGHVSNRRIPGYIFEWGREAALVVLNELVDTNNGPQPAYSTPSKLLADDVQRLALHAGYAANIKVHTPTTTSGCPLYTIRIITNKCTPQINHSGTKNNYDHVEEIIESTEPVWGITVPNHTLYVRVNGIPVWSGNSGRAGNKGVVSQIIADDEMIKDEAGKPIDVIMTSAGVVSRTNPGIIIESAVGKVAEKTGKPILVESLSGRDNVKWAKDLLKQHGIKDKETVYDPVIDKKIPNVFVGRQYVMKLMKSTDTNFSARSIGGYDVNQQPTKGGTTGAKAMGKMEMEALIAHNARNVLQEASTVRSQKNDEYWRAIQLGLPTPQPKTSFAYDKFLGMLQGAGTRVHRDNTRMSLLPLTDKDVTEMSSGSVVSPLIVKAKGDTILPERGGLFDPVATGGLSGTKWAHIDLAEPVISPTFRDPVRRLLGLTNPQLDKVISEKGGDYIKEQLSQLDLDKKEEEITKAIDKKSAGNLDNEIKQLKYIKALKSQNLRPEDAYVVSKVPVIPPAFRPVVPSQSGQEVLYGDINPLYRDLLYVNSQFADVKKTKLLPGEEQKLRKTLYDSVGAVYGVNDPITAKSKARGHKGFLTYIAGTNSPKTGYFHSKLLSKTQDVAGRGTIIPDTTLGIDEVGLPEEMMWGMYDKFVIRRLVQQGYPALHAAQMVKDRHPVAKEALLLETQERPVMINRAPTLHRYNIVGAYPKLVPGKTIRVNPFIEAGTNSDYDGDTMMVHAPISAKAVEEVKQMTLSNMLYTDKAKNDLLVFPNHEAIMGIAKATQEDHKNKPIKFKTKAEALNAYHANKIDLGTRIDITDAE
jgi:DNA-directed RNA polymerase beta subunit